VPQLLKEFLKDTTITFCGAAIANDVHMLRTYKIEITSAYDLQKIVLNPTDKLTPSLYDLANATIGTHLENKKRIKKKEKKMDKKKYKKKGEEEEEEEDDDEEDDECDDLKFDNKFEVPVMHSTAIPEPLLRYT
jgi:hypothetical protein